MPPTYTTPLGELHLSKEAFNRLCERCDNMFKSISEGFDRAKQDRTTFYRDEVPFGSWNELLNSASKGDCHFCCSYATQVLMSERNGLVTPKATDFAVHCYSSLQPVASERGLLEMEIKPAIATLPAGANKALILCREFCSMGYENSTGYMHFHLDLVGEDGKRIRLTNPVGLTRYKELPTYLARDFPSSLNTESEASLNQVLQWIENCVSNHPSCNYMVHEQLQGQYPSRFIEVGSVGSPTAKVCESAGIAFRKQRYTTLSHCWGSSVPTRLLLENHDSLLQGFALAELPKTFQEAIVVTRRLNVQFLWIDSLCIIQNSADDWAAESAKMCFVYQNTYLNLAAGASLNSKGGLFLARHPLSFTPWVVTLSDGRILAGSYNAERDRLALNTRGWVLQEQVLSRRTLIFGKQELHWECSMGEASECFPDPVDPSEKYSRIPRARTRDTPLPELMELSKGELLHDSERHKVWALLVYEYTGRRSLTKQSDKLVAISGLAENLSKGWNGITYLAGLWSYCFRQNLLWKCSGGEQSKARNTDIAPSWSWASLNTECSLPTPSPLDAGMDSLATILEATVTKSRPMHLFGQVTGGAVRIKGPVIRATVRSQPNSPQDSTHGWWECDLVEQCATVVHTLDMDWDEEEPRNLALSQSAIVYLAPLEVHLQFPIPSLWHLGLKGLFLRPASGSCREGKFERLGVFEISDSIKRPRPRARFNPYKSKDPSTIRKGSSDRPKQPRKAFSMVYSTDEVFPELTSGSEEKRAALLRSDPYLNGPLNIQLKNRYSPELEPEHYPKLGRFFKALELAAQHNREKDNPDENLGHDEGDGFYIYELV
ncbi:HET-domain-containing protein [Sordaria sp. MPI-SDFR-AT-0083]|nr:HET-domain-containing protein [Sordaria sp. MPI-SDFR-AT-0083]